MVRRRQELQQGRVRRHGEQGRQRGVRFAIEQCGFKTIEEGVMLINFRHNTYVETAQVREICLRYDKSKMQQYATVEFNDGTERRYDTDYSFDSDQFTVQTIPADPSWRVAIVIFSEDGDHEVHYRTVISFNIFRNGNIVPVF